MIFPVNIEELASYVSDGRDCLLFTADWAEIADLSNLFCQR